MKPQELRIGNYVLFAEDNTVFRVVQIEQNGLEVQNSEELTWIEIECFEGIPLTEEWLLMFGFVRGGFSKKASDSFYEIAVGASGLFINPDNGVVWIERGTNIFNNPALIEYVHQLQNLYFALTGEELTIKDLTK